MSSRRVGDIDIAFVDVPSRVVGAPPGRPDREAPTVLLLHGFPDIATTFAPLLRPLAEAGYRCVAPWLRGYPPTGTGGFTDEGTLLADALGLIDALDIGSVFVVGHDWGADLAYGLSAARPAQVAASVAMAVPHTRPFRRNRRGDFDQLRRLFYVWFFQIGDLAERTLPIDDWAFVRRLWREWSPGWEPPAGHLDEVVRTLATPGAMETALGYYRALFDAARVDPSRAALLRAVEEEDIRVPTLLLMGERDGCISPGMAAGGDDVFVGPYRVDVLEGCGHFLHLERPDEVARRLLAWFADHPAPPVAKPVASGTGDR